MRLGISSFTYGWSVGVPGSMPARPMTWEDLLRKAVAFDIDVLQIGDNLPLHDFSPDALLRFRDESRSHGVAIEVGARGLTPQQLVKYIEIAKVFDARILRVVTDAENYAPGIAEIVRIINGVVPLLHENDLFLGIENHDRLKAREIALILEEINDPHVGVCLDCVNSIGAGEGLEHVLSILAPYTINLHVKDFAVERLPHKMGFTVTGAPAGQGLTNVPLLLSELAKHGRCQSAVLEQWVVPGSTIEATVTKEQQWAEAGISYLKSLPEFHKIKQH